MDLKSPAFREGDPIPKRFTCEGEDVSPRLDWSDVPEGAVELLLIVEDPDSAGGVWTHWVISGLDPGRGGIDEGEVPPGAVQGVNDFDRIGYGGPCPPVGHGIHRYYFNLYALSAPSGLTEGATREEARSAIRGKILEEARFMAQYERQG